MLLEENQRKKGTVSDSTRKLLRSAADQLCGHIKKPYTLLQIVQELNGHDYNAELLLRHLLCWLSRRYTTNVNVKKSVKRRTACKR